VWELVARCQEQWGYSDKEMAAWIGCGRHVDVRGWMLRSTAERILRRLSKPRPATAGTAALARQLNLEEQAAGAAHERAVARAAALRRLHAAGAGLDDVAAELRVSTRTAGRIAAEAGLSFRSGGRPKPAPSGLSSEDRP